MQNGTTIQVRVHFTPTTIEDMQLKDKSVIVIDVLRASTTIATALQNGAKEIIPVSTIESAVKVSGSLFGDVTLRAGERNGRMIEGFNLGNSPAEYKRDIINGKSIILLTTNGSRAMVKGRYAKNLVVASFVNLSLVVEFLTDLQGDFIIICSGQDNNFSLEDTICAGRILNQLEKSLDARLVLDDAAQAAKALDKALGKNILKMVKQSSHGLYLEEIGFGADLETCSVIDSVPVLPMLNGNVIRVAKEPVKQPVPAEQRPA